MRVMVEAPTQAGGRRRRRPHRRVDPQRPGLPAVMHRPADGTMRRLARGSSTAPSARASRSLGPMCGIVGIVSRVAARPAPTPDDVLAGLHAALAARGDVAAVTAAAASVDEALRGVPGLSTLTAHADLPVAITARLDQLDAYAAEVDADARHVVARPRRPRDGERGADRAPRRALGDPARPVADGGRGDGAGRRCVGRRRAQRLPLHPAGAVGDRPHGGARPRLGRHPRVRVGPRPRRRRPGDPGARRRARARPAVRERRGATRRPQPVARLQGGRRDR